MPALHCSLARVVLRTTILALMVFIAAWNPSAAQGQALVLDDSDVLPLEKGLLAVLRDPSRQLTLDQVRQGAAQERFRALKGHLGEGYSPDAWWLRFRLDNRTGSSHVRWLEVMPAFLDELQVHHIGPDGKVDTRRGGELLPFSAREEKYRGHVFKFDLQPGSHEFFIRIQTTSTVAALLKLWEPGAFTRHHRQSYFGFGLYFSLILTVMVFSAMGLFAAPRREIVVYVAFLLFNAMQWLSVHGFTSEFIFPSHPAAADLTLKVSMPLVGVLAVYFYILTLELREHHRYAYWLSVSGIVACVVGLFASLLGYFQEVAGTLLIFAMLSLLTIPWPAYRKWKTRDVSARLTAVAYVLFGMLAAVNILGTLAVLPYSERTLSAGLASNLCHILLLHFALMQRLRSVETERAAALERSALAERRAEAERAHREDQNKLIAMITHEIRTPIAVIDAATQTLAEMDSAPSPERMRRYDRVRRSVDRLAAILDLSLTQASLDIGSLQHSVVEFHAEQLTRDVELLVGPEAASRLRVECNGQLPSLEGDVGKLRFALLNLIDNACKFSPAGSPVVIRMMAQSSHGQNGVAWEIEDQGSGIPAGMEEKIFEKFYRAAETARGEFKPGLGLGLYLCRYIAEQHRGWVRAESGIEQGARFTLWLPQSQTVGGQ